MITDEQKKIYKDLLEEQKRILNKIQKKSKLTFIASSLFGAVLGLLIVVIGIVLETKGILEFDSYLKYIVLGFGLFCIFFILQIIIHEAGHLIFGLQSGYGFLSFRIFSLTFIKKDGRIHRKKFSIAGTVGQCLMYPPERKADGSFPYVLYNLGGGLANLLISLPFLILALYTDHGVLRTVYITFFTSGILMGATNLIPMDLGLHNDGMNLVSLSKGKDYQDSLYLMLKVNAEMTEGKLITDYSPEIFTMPEGAHSTNMLIASKHLYSYHQLLARHDFESAYKLLMEMNENIEEYPLAIYNIILAEKLFFMVIDKRPIEEIAAIYHRVRLIFASAKSNIDILRIRYIYEALLSEDDKKDIMGLIKGKVQKNWKECDLPKLRQEIEKTAENYPVMGEAAMHLDILEYCVDNYYK